MSKLIHFRIDEPATASAACLDSAPEVSQGDPAPEAACTLPFCSRQRLLLACSSEAVPLGTKFQRGSGKRNELRWSRERRHSRGTVVSFRPRPHLFHSGRLSKDLGSLGAPSRSSIQRRCLARDADERNFLDGPRGRGQAGGGHRAVASPPLGPQPQSEEKTHGLSAVGEARAR